MGTSAIFSAAIFRIHPQMSVSVRPLRSGHCVRRSCTLCSSDPFPAVPTCVSSIAFNACAPGCESPRRPRELSDEVRRVGSELFDEEIIASGERQGSGGSAQLCRRRVSGETSGGSSRRIATQQITTSAVVVPAFWKRPRQPQAFF